MSYSKLLLISFPSNQFYQPFARPKMSSQINDTILKARLKELFAPYVSIVLDALLARRLPNDPEYTAGLKTQLEERFNICLEISVDETLHAMRQEIPQLDASYEELAEPLVVLLKGPLNVLFEEYVSSLCLETCNKEASDSQNEGINGYESVEDGQRARCNHKNSVFCSKT